MRAVAHAVYQARAMLAQVEMDSLQTLPLCLPRSKVHRSHQLRCWRRRMGRGVPHKCRPVGSLLRLPRLPYWPLHLGWHQEKGLRAPPPAVGESDFRALLL